MVTVEEAERIIFSHLFPRRTEFVPVDRAAGRILAEPVYADRDFPPFDRVAMDGIAIAFDTFASGARRFPIAATQAAGRPQLKLTNPENCIEVMTGAVLPAGTDTVIRYEDITIEEKMALINGTVTRSANIHRQGADALKGQSLLDSPVMLSSAEVALLASTGISNVGVLAYPRAAVISSGDELVDVSATPEPHQIRRSNTYALQAAMHEMQWPSTRHHFPDEKEVLFTELGRVLTDHDMLILSGGVSRGKFDFIPEVLERLVVCKFHQVRQRPGKPFWFGVSPQGKVVFALPGNPVSTFMCFFRYIRPWIKMSFGLKEENQTVILAEDVNTPLPLTQFLQVHVSNVEGRLLAHPLAGGGSGDFANLSKVTGFMELPPATTAFHAGEKFPYYNFRM